MTLPFLRLLPPTLAAGRAGLWLGLTLTAAAAPTEKVVVQLPYQHQFQFAGLYAAEARGYFRDRGLEVEFRTVNTERSRPLEEVLTGRAQFGVSQGPQLVASRLEGADLVVLAAVMQHSPQVLVSRAEDNIRSPHDLLGKRVSLDQTSLISEVRVMLEREGVAMDKIVVVPNRWDVDELQAHTADAMSTFIVDGPFELEQAGIKVSIMRPLDYGVDFYGDCFFTRGALVRERPDLVAAMRQAVIQGWDYALKNPEEMIGWILQHYGPSQPKLNRAGLRFEAKQTAQLINADLVSLGHMNEGRWRTMGEIIQAQYPSARLPRLEGFVYLPPDAANHWQWILPWLGWGLLVAVGAALLAVLASWRLRRLVEQRTRELLAAERRQREMFDQVPTPITLNDYAEILPHLVRLRQEGVVDLDAHFAKNPELVRDWCAQVRIVDANQLAMQLAGVNSVAALDRRRIDMLPPQAIEDFRQALLAIWKNQTRMRLESSYLATDGSQRDIMIDWSAPAGDGRPDYTRVQVVYNDLSDIRQAYRSLRESEKRYRLLFEQSPIAIVEYDYSALKPWFEELRRQGVTDLAAYFAAQPDARREALARSPLLAANPTMLKLLGAPSLQELMDRLPEVMTEQVIETRCQNVIRIWRNILVFQGEITLRRLDGELRTMAIHWQMQSENGQPTFRRTQTVMVDITERLAAEQALRESEARYRGLFENAVGGVYRSTPDGRFIAVNPALARMLGFATPQELIDYDHSQAGRPFYVQPGRREEFLAQKRQGDFATNFESEIRLRDGSTIWISENARIVRDAQGNDLYHEGFVSDITMQRRLDQEMQRASKLEAVGILAGGIAHDFNNILTAVLGNITLAEMDAGPDAPGARLLGEAKRATLRARDLTQQLLTFAKGGEPIRSTVKLPELLRDTAEFSLHGAKVRAEYQIPPDLWPVDADRGQLGQVLQNLIINAVQAMPQGGVLKISAENVVQDKPVGSEALPNGRYVKLGVADSGTGIAPEHLAKIFDPYFTTKQQGSGLGLATAYSIIKKHQGHIEVSSQLGQGTTFKLWLPAAAAAASNHPFDSSAEVALPVRVLFMDDEEPIRRLAGKLLERLKVEVVLVADGKAVLQKYQEAWDAKRPFDAVVMDLTIPGGMGGREAIDHLRKIDPAVCAIVSSGYSQDPVLANYRAHGFSAVLPKPYDMDQLRQVLNEIQNHRAASSGG